MEVVSGPCDRFHEPEPFVEVEEEALSVLPDDFKLARMGRLALLQLDQLARELQVRQGLREDLITTDSGRPVVGDRPGAGVPVCALDRDDLDAGLIHRAVR